MYAYIRSVTIPASPDVEMRADHSHDEDPAQVCASLSLPACMHKRHIREPASTRRHLPALLITFASTSPVKNTLFHPSPSESSLPSRRNRNWDPDPLDAISVTLSSNSPPPPLQRSVHKSKIQTPQFMAHILILSLPPGAHVRLRASKATAP